MTTLAITEPDADPDLSGQRFLFHQTDWKFYESVLRRVEGRHVFVTYDRGRLEIMSPSWTHEEYGRFMGKLVPIVAKAMGLPYRGGGSTTFRRQRRQAGLEPDQCFYIRNAPRIQGKRRIDLRVDPPPDLAIEIEVSRRMERQDVYARLGVPELWRYDGHQLRVLRLGKDNRYRRVRRSANFPRLPIDEVHDLIQKLWDLSEADWEDLAAEWAERVASR